MANLVEILDASYNVVRPMRDHPYPVMQYSKIVYIDPLSAFVSRFARDELRARKFVVALSFIGSRVTHATPNKNLLVQNFSTEIAELNVSDKDNPTSAMVKCLAESPTPDADALLTIVETLTDIPPAAWLCLDHDTIRFAKSIAELANIVHDN